MSEEKKQADPKLLALLDKLEHPLEKIRVQAEVTGVFGFPEEWKATDDANPFFTYTIKFSELHIPEGKIQPRIQTELEKFKEEEEKAAKQKKAPPKKGKDEGPTQEEIEKQQKLKALEEEDQKINQEIESLEDPYRTWRKLEDKTKFPAIKFDKNPVGAVDKEGDSLVIFEERVYEDGMDFIYFIKSPNLTEEEIAKMKKAKPKGLNINDLNPIVTRGKLNLEEFRNPGQKEIVQRVYLEQVEIENPDTPKPNLKNTYILLKIVLTPEVTPLIQEYQVKVTDIIQKPLPPQKQPASIECIREFKGEIILAMESISQEYSNMFAKELNSNQEQKSKNTLTVQKKAEMQKRKETFLYDFNVTGKYKILKERLKKSIVKICRDKFQKQGSITGITAEQKDQFYSELYVFLMEQMRSTMSELINQKKEELHEDIVVNYEQAQKELDNSVKVITKESEFDKLVRLSLEYEILNQKDISEKNYKQLLKLNQNDPKTLFSYAKFCLRQNHYYKAEELVEKAISFDMTNQEYILLMCSLYLNRQRFKECWVLLKSLIDQDPINILYNQIATFLYKLSNEPKLYEKYRRITERIKMRQLQLIGPKGNHKVQPNPFEIPNFKQIQINLQADLSKKGPQLSNDQQDDLWLEVIEYFSKNSLWDLIDKAVPFVLDQTQLKIQVIQSQVEFNKGTPQNTANALQILNKILESNPKNIEVVMLKANICYVSQQLFEIEEIFLKALKLKAANPFNIYLRLGYVYLERKSWGDAREFFLKACKLMANSSLSWLGLGISSMRLGYYSDAEEALTQANIFDPFNGNAWGFLTLNCLNDNNRFIQANQALREMMKTDVTDLLLLEELGDKLASLNQNDSAEKVFNQIFVNTRDNSNNQLSNYGELRMKLGRTQDAMRKYQEAKQNYEIAYQNLEGENDKQALKLLLEQVQFQLEQSQKL